MSVIMGLKRSEEVQFLNVIEGQLFSLNGCIDKYINEILSQAILLIAEKR